MTRRPNSIKVSSGTKLIVTREGGTRTGPLLQPGTILTLSSVRSVTTFIAEEYPNNYFDFTDFELNLTKKEDILSLISVKEKDIEYLSNEIADLRNKLLYLDEIGTDKFDETEFKVFCTLRILAKEGLTEIEKTRTIAQLINS